MMMMRSMINSEIGLRSITMMNEEFLSSVIKWTMLPIDQKTLFFMIFFSYEEWEYCGSSGQTRYDVRCVSECAQKGKDYW